MGCMCYIRLRGKLRLCWRGGLWPRREGVRGVQVVTSMKGYRLFGSCCVLVIKGQDDVLEDTPFHIVWDEDKEDLKHTRRGGRR